MIEIALGLILSIVCLLGFYSAAITFLRVPFSFSPVFTISCLTLLIYIGALTGTMLFMAYALSILGISLCGVTFYISTRILKNTSYWRDTASYCCLLFFCAAMTLIGTHTFTHPDEVHFWGKLVAFLYQHNQLPTPSTADFKFLDYPPGAALFQYFILKQFHFFHDEIVYFAQQILIFSCLFVVTALKEWKKVAVAMMACLFVLSDFRGAFLYSIYVDSLVACFFAAIILIYHLSSLSKHKTLFVILPILCFLTLIKQVAFPIALLAAVIIIADLIASDNRKKNLSALFLVSLLIFGCLLTHSSWVLHYHHLGVSKTFQTKEITLSDLLRNFSSHASTHTKLVIQHFAFAFFIYVGDFNRLMINPFLCMLLVSACYFIIFKKLKRELKPVFPFSIQVMIFYISFILFSLGLLILYIHSYTYFEAKNIASFGRYFDIYFIAWFMIIFTQLIQLMSFSQPNSKKIIIFCIVVLTLILFASNYSNSKKHSGKTAAFPSNIF